MPAVLHIVPRPHAAEPSPLARDLAALPWTPRTPTTSRVLELVDPRPPATVVDLSLCERDVPELTALLHIVTEIHLHGVHPRHVLRVLPAVRPAVLAGIALVVHGPLAPTRATDEPEPTWPGPVTHDTFPRATLDLHAPELLPRACGPLPLVLDEGGRLAVVCLGEGVPEALRSQLRYGIEALSPPGLRIEVYDEHDHPLHDRSARRRCAQAVILPAPTADNPHGRSYLESLAQGLPVIVLGPLPNDAPSGVVSVGDRDALERCISCIRAWSGAWAGGEAAAVDVHARRRWLAQRCA